MDASKFTTRSVEAINAAQTLATTTGNAQTEPVHLLVALMRQDQGIAPTLLEKAGVDAGAVARAAEHELASLPKASGATVSTAAASGATTRTLARAIELATGMKDDFAATEHLLMALAEVDSPARAVLSGAGVTPDGAARSGDRDAR